MAEPLGLADSLFFSVPATSLPRVARLVEGNWPAALASRPDDSLFFRAAPRAIQATALLGNQPEYLTLDIPSAGTMAAAAVARMYAALIGEVDGVRLITPDRLTWISTVVTADTDRVLGAPIPKRARLLPRPARDGPPRRRVRLQGQRRQHRLRRSRARLRH